MLVEIVFNSRASVSKRGDARNTDRRRCYSARVTEQAGPVQATPTPLAPATIVAWTLAAANVGMFLALELSGGSESRRALIQLGAKIGPLIDQGQYWRLITAAFLHVGPGHLFFNLAALLTFGRLAEVIFGHSRFLVIYLLAAVASTVASYAFLPGLSVGASGALFGIGGALVVFYAINHRLSGPTGRSQLTGYAMLLAANAAFGFFQPGIDNYGHLGGLVAGAVLGFFLAPRFVATPSEDSAMLDVRAESSPLISWLAAPAVALAIALVVFTIHGARS